MKPMLPHVPGLDELIRHADRLQLRTVSRWLGLSLLLGLCSGVLAAALFVGMDWVRSLVIGTWAGVHMLEPDGERSLFDHAAGPARTWLLVLAPATGGLVVGLLARFFRVEGERYGTDGLIRAFHNNRQIPPKVPFVNFVSAIVLIGTGGSAGREGPTALVSGAIGQVVARVLRLPEREGRLMLLAGAAGGVGAIFRTPLGAALFVIEVLYRDDTEVEGFVPAVMSSVMAYSTFTVLLGGGRIFAVPEIHAFQPGQIPLYVLMAIGCAIMGVICIGVLGRAQRSLFQKLRLPAPCIPALGGLGVGLLALVTPLALGAGYGFVQVVIRDAQDVIPKGWPGVAFLLGIAVLKIITTTLSVGSSGAGGIFGPSVVIGGLTGGAFGHLFHFLMPGLVPHPSAFVIVGMACYVGGVDRAPVSTLVMATEMTGSYELLVPLMLAEAITFVVLQPWTVFPAQVPSRRESGAHWAEHMFDLLHDHHVHEAFRPNPDVDTVPAATPLGEVLRRLSGSAQTVLPVVDEQGAPQGLVTLEALRTFMFEESLGDLALAYDCQQTLVTLLPDDTLSTALDRFISSRASQLPVVSEEDPNRIVGLLAYEDLMRVYDRARDRPGHPDTRPF